MAHCNSFYRHRALLNVCKLTWSQRAWIHRVVRLDQEERLSPINIQLLSERMKQQVFPDNLASDERVDGADVKKTIKHLTKHGLWGKESAMLQEVDFALAKLQGSNIEEHFKNIAIKQTEDYRVLADELIGHALPMRPREWRFAKGWTMYCGSEDPVPVDYPKEGAIVFDIECLVQEGSYPTMATAVSSKAWYSWCSDSLMEDKFKLSKRMELQDLIPLETPRGSNSCPNNGWKKRLVIGHNVGFDRSFVKEQYYIKGTKLRFLDTMSLHIAISGLTNFQRILYKATKTNSKRKEIIERKHKRKYDQSPTNEEWLSVGTMNNLSDVYKLHCGGQEIDKAPRDIFMQGTMTDVREQFQALMSYCASDVEATHAIFVKLWKEYFERFPHPVTLAGMLEMGTTYLPINQNWEKYIQQANSIYEDLQRELKLLLIRLANEACEYLHDDRYKDDPWIWNLDWTVADMKLNKSVKTKEKKQKSETAVGDTNDVDANGSTAQDNTQENSTEEEEEVIPESVLKVLSTEARLPKVRKHMAGYPAWYRDLCPRWASEDWYPGPSLVSTQTRVTPLLMRLTWDGYPVHYDETHGWGYLVPGRDDNLKPRLVGDEEMRFPSESVFKFCQTPCPDILKEEMSIAEYEKHINDHLSGIEDMDSDEKRRHWGKAGFLYKRFDNKKGVADKSNKPNFHKGNGPYNSVDLPGCWFFKLPHKDGAGKRVGNPLAKDFLNKIEDGTLKASTGASANRALRLSKMCSYWKNNQQRITSQMAVWLKKGELTRSVTRSPAFDDDSLYGAIVPRVVPAGTVTRRAVERTWLTASNAYSDRVGSELKAMVQAPPGYHVVGADVDSQELWIAAILGDSHFANMHGSTALGWMTLQGKKSDGTDLHSKTAQTVGISRDHAKVFNYGRIYGAGQKFAEMLLMQFNHRLTPIEAKEKARLMYSTTKGVRNKRTSLWEGGSESPMFNMLESIARSEAPVTPVLGCHISKALEPRHVNMDFMTSRINWVVQSSAVDYLHLMLVSMRWLIEDYGIDGRFCISLHDEVRYLVKSEDRYRAALALQMTNLYTRSMFAYKLGMNDLPQSVAFFSSVDIDSCFRKEVNMDCKTPSNPHGMERGYAIPEGEALDIYDILAKTNKTLQASKQPKERVMTEQQTNTQSLDKAEFMMP